MSSRKAITTSSTNTTSKLKVGFKKKNHLLEESNNVRNWLSSTRQSLCSSKEKRYSPKKYKNTKKISSNLCGTAIYVRKVNKLRPWDESRVDQNDG